MSATLNKKVVLDGLVWNYEDKKPYVRSGRSIWGGLELDETERKVRCHECGEYFTRLGLHIQKTENLSIRDYKIKHFLAMKRGLIAPVIRVESGKRAAPYLQPINVLRAKYPDMKKPERQGRRNMAAGGKANIKSLCLEQLRTHMAAYIGEYSEIPSGRDFQKYVAKRIGSGSGDSYSVQNALARFSKTYTEFVKWCGFDPVAVFHPSLSEVELLDLLRSAYVALGRPLRYGDFRAPLLVDRGVYVRRFGSLRKAFESAGLGLVHPNIAT